MWSLSSAEYLIIIVPRSHYFPDNIACVLREREVEEEGWWRGGGQQLKSGVGNAAAVGMRGLQHENKRWKKTRDGKGGQGNKGARETEMKRRRLRVTYKEEREEEEDSSNNSLVLSLYSDKFPSHRGVSGPAGARPDDKPPPPCTAAPAIYDQATYTSRPDSQLGLVLGQRCHSWDPLTPSNGATLSRPSPPPLPCTLSVNSAHRPLVTDDNSVLRTFFHLPALSTGHLWQPPTRFSLIWVIQ